MQSTHLLQTQLERYAGESGRYPLHMPGHKRRTEPAPGLPYRWDLTEVEGVDDLHEAEGILAQAMERTASVFGAQKSWYLVNGSTCGLLAGIRALAPAGSHILAARNCHKAVYHAVELGHLQAEWLTPPVDPFFGVYLSVDPETVRAALEQTPAACVVITSPTYEGVISDVRTLADICHAHGAKLLVDEAHGAHLGLAESWPESALHQGADLVVQSAHKTLPSLTQTAFLHMGKGSLADPEEVERQLDVFETSSPSYPLLASLDGCTGLIARDGQKLFAGWAEMLERFDRKIASLRYLRVLGHDGNAWPGVFVFDPGKLPVCTAGTNLTGTSLAKILREQYGFETEMACGNITLAMTSPCDDPAELDRFARTLCELDAALEARPLPAHPLLPTPGESVCTIAEAVVRRSAAVPVAEAEGRISAEYIWAYPPGVPLTAPGERITADFLEAVGELSASGTELHHSHCKKSGQIQVLT